MRYQFRSADHPCADGRTPQDGEAVYSLEFRLEDHRSLKIYVGMATMIEIGGNIMALAYEDAFQDEIEELANKIVEEDE